MSEGVDLSKLPPKYSVTIEFDGVADEDELMLQLVKIFRIILSNNMFQLGCQVTAEDNRPSFKIEVTRD